MPACSAVMGVIGVSGGMGLGVGGYALRPPGSEVVVCNPDTPADIRPPWGCEKIMEKEINRPTDITRQC